MLEILIWLGAAMSVVGLALLLWCIVRVMRARRAGLDDAALRGVLQSVLPINLGALLLSVMGLMLVAIGILLT